MTDQPAPPTTPPGWYDDGTGGKRWWDGTQWAPYFAPPVAPVVSVSGMAVAAFIVGLVALLVSFTPVAGWVGALIGFVLSMLGFTDTTNRRGRGFAVAGLVLSICAAFAGIGYLAIPHS